MNARKILLVALAFTLLLAFAQCYRYGLQFEADGGMDQGMGGQQPGMGGGMDQGMGGGMDQGMAGQQPGQFGQQGMEAQQPGQFGQRPGRMQRAGASLDNFGRRISHSRIGRAFGSVKRGMQYGAESTLRGISNMAGSKASSMQQRRHSRQSRYA